MNRQWIGARGDRIAQWGFAALATRRGNSRTGFTGIPAIAGFVAMFVLCAHGFARAADPPVIDSISPDEVVEKPVPQPTLTVTGEDLSVQLFQQPTLTIEHTDLDGISFSAVMNVNFAGTEASVPGGLNHFNMLQMPLGTYDVTITRPDGASTTVPGGFALIEEPEIDLAPGEVKMTVASRWGGPIKGMDLSEDGTIAYVANGRAFRILDLSDESKPVELGSMYMKRVNDVKVQGNHAFIAAASPHRFAVVDVSDPAAPELVWHQSSGQNQGQVELDGGLAYVMRQSSSQGHIMVFDISDPVNVESLGTVTSGHTFAIDDGWLFVGGQIGSSNNTFLRIYALLVDPVNPPLIGKWTGEGDGVPHGLRAQDIAVTGQHIYVGGRCTECGGWLVTINVADSAELTITNAQDDFNVPESVAVLNGHLFVTDRRSGAAAPPSQGKGLVVFDIEQNPAHPAPLAVYKSHSLSDPYGVFAGGADDRLYKIENSEGLIVLDIESPSQPERLGHYHSPSSLRQMQKSDDHLFVLDEYGGMSVLDVAEPGNPQVVGHHLLKSVDDIRTAGMDLALEGDLVFISARGMGLEVLDVRSPHNPQLVGEYRLDQNFPCQYFGGFAVHNESLYVRWYDSDCWTWLANRLLILDVADPADIEPLGSTASSNEWQFDRLAIHSDGDVAYGGYDIDSTFVFDVSDYENPEILPDTIFGGTDLRLYGDYFFVAHSHSHPNVAEFNGVLAYHISDPASPSLANQIDPGTRYFALDVQNERLYAYRAGNLELFDITDPAEPIALDGVSIGGGGSSGVHHVLTNEPNNFVTNSGTSHSGFGLTILDVHGIEPKPECAPADLNCDGVVDVLDLLILIGAWGECDDPDDCPADVTGPDGQPDGVVDVLDLLDLIASWG